jgi:hypothetical protein
LFLSLDISNIQIYQDKYFIFVAVSCIEVGNDMEGEHHDYNENDDCDKCKQYEKGPLKSNEFQLSPDDTKDDKFKSSPEVDMQPLKKGTAIYRLKLNKLVKQKNQREYEFDRVGTSYYNYDGVSGICRFVDNEDKRSKNNDKQEKQSLKRFLILNYHGIYNFKFNFDKGFTLEKRFKYPKNFRHELNNTGRYMDCMDRLLSCLYNQYFLTEQYKNDVQVFEGKCCNTNSLLKLVHEAFLTKLYIGVL